MIHARSPVCAQNVDLLLTRFSLCSTYASALILHPNITEANFETRRLCAAAPACVDSRSATGQPCLPAASGPPCSGNFPRRNSVWPCGGGSSASSVARPRAAAGLSAPAACCQAEPGALPIVILQPRCVSPRQLQSCVGICHSTTQTIRHPVSAADATQFFVQQHLKLQGCC